ncbi:hypothetical protein GGR56DRAFT_612731 [Xylariaceae sp. FL0804]|nr:hypothetical protein GGR56DRAFT_612731 [Xylariaceae sp. FL0804]
MTRSSPGGCALAKHYQISVSIVCRLFPLLLPFLLQLHRMSSDHIRPRAAPVPIMYFRAPWHCSTYTYPRRHIPSYSVDPPKLL